MDTLYCFKLCEDTGEILRFVIPEYHVESHMWNSNKDAYCFTANFGTQADYPYKIRKNKLDQMYHGKVFTFKDDYDYAVDIILEEMRHNRLTSWEKYQNELRKRNAVYKFLREKRGKNGT